MPRRPTDPSRLAGHRKHQPFRLVHTEPAEQPKLPGRADRWPAETRAWWDMQSRSPLATDYTEIDWHELLITARLHAMIWQAGELDNRKLKAMAEYRLRQAKFGATPMDRQSLRITFATAEKAEDDAAAAKERGGRAGARQRRGPHLPDEPAE